MFCWLMPWNERYSTVDAALAQVKKHSFVLNAALLANLYAD
ncbi:MAG: hypothetical protein ACI8SJ_002159 [Shewanella sp.]|jgi:hypothetical protein